jgi:hypothetical protein
LSAQAASHGGREEERGRRISHQYVARGSPCMQQRNKMLDNFTQILQRLSTIIGVSLSNSRFGDATPFKVQVNFDIPIFEGQIDADALEKWLNFLKGYFYVDIFSDRENITFMLLKALPHVKHW